MDKVRLFVGCVAISFLASAVGSLFTFESVNTWYAGLARPSFSPPDSYFGPVWTLLYFLMGAALFAVVKDGVSSDLRKRSVAVFGLQLFLNALWSVVFFGGQSIFGGLVVILLLWISIVLMMYYFFRVNRRTFVLLLPYIMWVSFAAYLNYSIWMLNP